MTSRSRYTTALPSLVEETKYESQRVPSVQPRRPGRPTQSGPGLRSKDDSKVIENSSEDHDTSESSPESRRKQAVLLVDSSLPYRRPLRDNDTKNLAALLDLTDENSSSTSNRTGSTEAQSQSGRSESSNSNPNEHAVDGTKANEKASPRELDSNTTPSSSKSNTADTYDVKPTPPRVRLDFVSDEYDSPPKTVPPPDQSSAPILPSRNPKRTEQSSLENPPSSSEITSHILPPTRTGHDADKKPISELRSLLTQLPPPVPAECKKISRKPAVRAPHFDLAKPEPGVEYENVEGVVLDTQPAAIPEKRTGLSLPEIEARDVRDINIADSNDEQLRDDGDSGSHRSFFARAPSLPGANRHINAHTVPPGYGSEPQEHAASLTNSESSDKTHPDGLSQHSPIVSVGSGSSTDQAQPIYIPRVPRHSHSTGTRGSFETPTTIAEESREGSLNTTNHDDDDEELSAEPPPIAMSKEFEEREGRMSRGIQTAKGLLGRML